MSDDDDDRPQLDYALPLRWYRRRWLKRIALVLAALIALPLIAFYGLVAIDRAITGVKTYRNGRILSRCMTYEPPAPEQIVFDQRPGLMPTVTAAEPWVEWMQGNRRYPTVFLHGLIDPAPSFAGQSQQLLAMQIEPYLDHTYDGRTVGDRPVLCFYPWMVARAGSSTGWSLVSGSTLLTVLPQGGDDIKVFAGHVDPGDPSRFGFKVRYNGVEQLVSGGLRGNLITVTPQSGQVFTPEAWRHAMFWVPAGASDAQLKSTLEVIRSQGRRAPTTCTPRWNTPLVPTTLPTP